MSEQIGLVIIGLLMMGAMVFPFRHQKKVALLLSVGLTCCLIGGYGLFGNYARWQAHENKQQKIAKARAFMHQFKNPEEIIQALRARLDHTAHSAKGWYLLGRVYASLGRWSEARPAFSEAHQLKPKNVTYWVQYVMSLSQGLPQNLSDEQRAQFKQILLHHPTQPEALMFLAMDANVHHQADLAIAYWTRLLKILQPNSEEAIMIRQMIEKARTGR